MRPWAALARRGPTAAIELVDCIARGEAVLVRAEDGQGARFAWDNGLLVTSERLLIAGGGGQTSAGRANSASRFPARDGRDAERTLPPCRHPERTASAAAEISPWPTRLPRRGRGTCDAWSRSATARSTTSASESSGPATGIATTASTSWMIDRLYPETPPDRMGFDAWKSHWGVERENLPHAGPLAWRTAPPASRCIALRRRTMPWPRSRPGIPGGRRRQRRRKYRPPGDPVAGGRGRD